MGQFSLTHLLILAVILLLFFGPSRLPQLGQSLGRAIRGFKSGLNDEDEEEARKNQRSVGSNANSQLRPPDAGESLRDADSVRKQKDPNHRE